MSKFLDYLYTIPWQEGMKAKNKGENSGDHGSIIYGEITRGGVNNFITALSDYINSDSVFYDIGSGIGKMVMHVNHAVGCKAVGIEMSKGRVDKANEIKLFCSRDKVTFINDIFQNCDISDATIIYSDTTVMKENVMRALWKQAPKGCLLVTSRPLVFRAAHTTKNQFPQEYVPLKGVYDPGKKTLINRKESSNILLGSTYARNMRGYCIIKE